MKLNRFFLGAMLIASQFGCAETGTQNQTWFKEGATAREQEAALASAEVQASQAHATKAEERDIVIRNMTAQGWRLVSSKSAPPLKPETSRPLPPHIKPGAVVR
jgi:hypothetical protein